MPSVPGGRRYVVPLVNPPTIERFFRDRFSELPEPVNEPFLVEVQVPEGFDRADVWLLSDEPRTGVSRLEAEADDGVLEFEVPGLTIFRVLVIDFRR